MKLLNELLKYSIAFIISMFLFVYILRLPYLVTQKNLIVNEYYFTNILTNLPLDFIFVLLYYLVAYFVINKFNIKKNVNKIIIIALVTVLLTGLFLLYFISNKQTSNFFSRWFHNVGYSSIIYDVLLLIMIYMVYKKIGGLL